MEREKTLYFYDLVFISFLKLLISVNLAKQLGLYRDGCCVKQIHLQYWLELGFLINWENFGFFYILFFYETIMIITNISDPEIYKQLYLQLISEYPLS